MNCKINGLLFIAFLMMMGCGISNDPKSLSTEYASTKCLAEADDIENASLGFKLIDMRRPEAYHQGHIPGALNVWRNQITDTSFAYDGMMATRAQMELLLGQLGIAPTDTILIYDQNANCDAARLWWILKFYGHQNIKLLNGGLKSWVAAKGELSNSEAKPEPSNYQFLAQPDSTIYASADHVFSILSNEEVILMDTRSTDEFNGKLKNGAARGGHIENALNLDWAIAVDFNGTQKFLDAAQLKANFQDVGLDGEKSVITYCHSGVRSAHTLFVLTELLGYRRVKNYDGSWTEWSHIHAK